uniref:60S large subunit ribosomal protein eL6 n=1 Tax=Euglena gracilis TaxID=3039 RepID=A0A7L5NZW5_EUGGR|nr:60S large subunit ribosomal protein eL6 [Euglena gracilis]6ZJ3_LU Chain LU, Ribosomal protein eL6 [Euglena gracilis]
MVRKGPSKKVTPTPGQVLILLSGRFRGRRVICLKELEHGIFLVTGPYKVNGVPLRRVNRRYCICTSTHIDISGLDLNIPEAQIFARRKALKKVKKALKGKRARAIQEKKDQAEVARPENSFLKRGKKTKESKSEEAFFEELKEHKKKKAGFKQQYQKQIDEPLIKRLKELDPLLTKYLSSIFTLQVNDKPHLMRF